MNRMVDFANSKRKYKQRKDWSHQEGVSYQKEGKKRSPDEEIGEERN